MNKLVKTNIGVITCVIFYPVIPFISLLIFMLIISSIPRISKLTYYLFFTLLSTYLGLINITKVPESDLINYYSFFFLVEDLSFLPYIFFMAKEPVFFIYNYLMYYLTNSSGNLYILITTIISYNFLFLAVLNFFKGIKSSKNIILFAIIIVAFFPQLFSLSAHLIRQFMAASILMYALVQKFFYKKTVWPFLLIAIFTHSTALLFIPLLYVNRFREQMKFTTILIISLFFFIIPMLLPIVIKLIINIIGNNFLTYALNRAIVPGLMGFQSIDFLQLILMFLMVFIVFIRQYNISKFSNNDSVKGFFHLSNIFFVFSVFILANLSRDDISQRFGFYTYFFFPLIIPLALTLKHNYVQFIRIFLSMFFIVFFIYRLQFGVWEYGSIVQILFGSIFGFFE